ncbi:MAG: thioredoxin family protein [Gemmatimonadota bacterium]|jgi:mercuric ion transport protein
MTVELVFFPGCPHTDEARRNLRVALQALGRVPEWVEWDRESPDTPEALRVYGSPTVLVDGRDVTGGGGEAAGAACRADGAPTVAQIRGALET